MDWMDILADAIPDNLEQRLSIPGPAVMHHEPAWLRNYDEAVIQMDNRDL